MKKMNKARETLIQKYIASLNENKLPWNRGWNLQTPENAVTGTRYKGINNAILSFIAQEKGYKGNRWCTFAQIADKNEIYHKGETWKLKKGSKSVPIEYWYMFDKLNQKVVSWSDYNKLIKSSPELKNNFVLYNKTYLVFNEDCIDGITPKQQHEEVNSNEAIENIIDNLDIRVVESGNEAFYSPKLDVIMVPPKATFKDQLYYESTLLHELCHATGHESRLNRNISNAFGTPDYAKEELRAEIGSSFMMQNLNLEYDDEHINNHKAYIQSWIEVLENDPNELFRAIKDATELADYLEKASQVLTYDDDYELNISDCEELVR